MTLVVLAGGYLFFFRDRVDVIDFKTVADAGSLPLGDPDKVDYPVTATLGDTTYVGWVSDKAFSLAAFDLDGKKKAWEKKIAGDNYKWQIYPNADGIVVTGLGSSDGGVAAVLDPDNGNVRGGPKKFDSQDRLYFYDSGWVVHSYSGKNTTAYGWNGGQKWSRPDNPKGTFIVAPTGLSDLRGPADLTGAPTSRDLRARKNLVSIDGDDKIRLLSGENGQEQRSWNNVGDSYDTYLTFDGKLFVAGGSTKYKIQVYDLGKQTEPTQIYSASDDKRKIVDIAPCGAVRLCVLDASQYDGSDTVARAISVPERKELWHADAKGTEVLVPVGKQLLATVYSGTPASALFTDDGTPILKNEDKKAVGVRATNGSLLFFVTPPSTSANDLSVVGVTASSGERVALGALPKTVGASCSWNASRIACVGDGKLQVWSLS